MLRRVVEASGRPTVFTLTQRHARPEVWRDLLRYADKAAADGVPIRPVVAPRAIGVLLGLTGSQNPFSGTPTYKSIAASAAGGTRPPHARSGNPRARSCRRTRRRTAPSRCSIAWNSRRCSASATRRNYQPKREDSMEAIAAREGRTPQEVAYDALLEEDGNAFIYTPLGNYAYYDLSVSETTLDDRNCIMGLGDGGAHVAFILDAGYQTWLLDYWGKQRKRWGIPELVRRLTSDTAHAAGLHDRGVLAVGQEGRRERDRLGPPGLRRALCRQRPAGRRQAAAAEGARLRGDDRVRPGHLPRRQGDRRVAGPPGARPAGGIAE